MTEKQVNVRIAVVHGTLQRQIFRFYVAHVYRVRSRQCVAYMKPCLQRFERTKQGKVLNSWRLVGQCGVLGANEERKKIVRRHESGPG